MRAHAGRAGRPSVPAVPTIVPGLDTDVVDKLLTTTRAVRRRLDLERPVPLDVVLECVELALQAPTGTNAQNWHWIVVTDQGVKDRLADLYRNPDLSTAVVPAVEVADTPQQRRVGASARHLRDHLEQVPVLVVPCVEAAGGAAGWAPSIYPAVWSFMLALRSRGLGSCLTTVHLYRRHDADQLLGVPDGFVQACLVPVAYYTGDDFRPAQRVPVGQVVHLDHWDNPVGS